jgi:hypothetical protein
MPLGQLAWEPVGAPRVGWASVRGIAIVLSLVSATARADDVRVLPCRPTVTCTAELSDPGTVELELGYQWRREAGDTQTTPFLLKLPLAHWLEVQVDGNGYTAAPGARYVDDAVVGAKLHLLDQDSWWPALAVTASAAIPGHDPFEVIATVHASKDAGRYHVDVNIGLDAWRNVRQPYAAIAVSRALTGRWSVAIEPHYFAYAEPLAQRDGGAIGALAFAARSWLVIDAAIDAVAIGPRAVAALAGVSIAPVRLWGGH